MSYRAYKALEVKQGTAPDLLTLGISGEDRHLLIHKNVKTQL